MGSFRPLRFGFTADGHPADETCAEMRVTYLGRVSRRQAEADARRRFEEWSRLGTLSRLRGADQVVLG
ncbi:conserved protein of unknown function [Magnetospirillum sp. XM-1]|uniref:hypothetical protein n=1 Tax=unclassified Magnetospirillum TaxID=2617991 RepID=UPI00073DD48C|nr:MULTISPECIES: hypothetical protein [unclassified Magnetospirillum]ARJ67704.1 hypothetical protein WV31_19605 [Magnetospirillum sp. ME-1]CUW39863.1 conserved protein of unknown function [Magnetospirillum sp. XM-1]